MLVAHFNSIIVGLLMVFAVNVLGNQLLPGRANALWAVSVSVPPQETLTASQAQSLDRAQGKLRRVVANVKLASSTAGSGNGPLTGSRAKLTKVRLGNSPAELQQVRALVKDLPEANGDVKAFLASLSKLQNTIDTIQARLEGRQPPPRDNQPSGKIQDASDDEKRSSDSFNDTGEMKGDVIKLDYRQRDALKKAGFNLREVEGAVSALSSLTESLKAMDDPAQVPYREVAAGVATLENAQRKYDWTLDSMKGLPTNGEGVAALVTRIQQAKDDLKSAADYLLPLNQKLAEMVDPASYPELQSDLKRIQEISGMFSNKMIFLTNRLQAAETVKQAQPALEEANRLASKYAALVQQQSPQGKAIDRQIKYLIKKQNEFLGFGKQQAAVLPVEIAKHLDRARSLSMQAVESQKPLFFTGGIPQELGFAEEKQKLLSVIDPQAAESATARIRTLKSELAVAQEKLSQKIIDENQIPADRFKGVDREKAIEVAIDAWKHQQGDFQLLANPIPGEAWARETMWQYSNGTWYFVDRSKLQVRLIVADQDNEKLAIIRPVTVIKDHQKGDSMIGVPLWNIKDKLQPSSYLLRTRVK